jgi:hypothetical protein
MSLQTKSLVQGEWVEGGSPEVFHGFRFGDLGLKPEVTPLLLLRRLGRGLHYTQIDRDLRSAEELSGPQSLRVFASAVKIPVNRTGFAREL